MSEEKVIRDILDEANMLSDQTPKDKKEVIHAVKSIISAIDVHIEGDKNHE